jgi:hypothetical protein
VSTGIPPIGAVRHRDLDRDTRAAVVDREDVMNLQALFDDIQPGETLELHREEGYRHNISLRYSWMTQRPPGHRIHKHYRLEFSQDPQATELHRPSEKFLLCLVATLQKSVREAAQAATDDHGMVAPSSLPTIQDHDDDLAISLYRDQGIRIPRDDDEGTSDYHNQESGS